MLGLQIGKITFYSTCMTEGDKMGGGAADCENRARGVPQLAYETQG